MVLQDRLGVAPGQLGPRSRRRRVPPSEYPELYEQRDRVEPLPFSQYWIGSYRGDRAFSIWVTPLVIEVMDVGSPPGIPSGYAMTLVLGKLLVQGVRFTEPVPHVELTTSWEFLDLWPPTDTFPWPTVGVADDAALDQMNRAKSFISQTKGVRPLPFKPPTRLPPSATTGDLIRLPLYCGKHHAFYPAALAQETLRTGANYVFLSDCPCPLGYIIRTKAGGAHMKRWGKPEAIEAAYEAWPVKSSWSKSSTALSSSSESNRAWRPVGARHKMAVGRPQSTTFVTSPRQSARTPP
jgi:hypothetical protein